MCLKYVNNRAGWGGALIDGTLLRPLGYFAFADLIRARCGGTRAFLLHPTHLSIHWCRVESDAWLHLKMDDRIWFEGAICFLEERLLINQHHSGAPPRPD